jgi:hypothetical protein
MFAARGIAAAGGVLTRVHELMALARRVRVRCSSILSLLGAGVRDKHEGEFEARAM